MKKEEYFQQKEKIDKEYGEKLREIEEFYKLKKEKLNEKYVKEKAIFKKGDLVTNGYIIIEVDEITYTSLFFNTPVINYLGQKYKKRLGKISPTKDKTRGKLYQYTKNLKLVKI